MVVSLRDLIEAMLAAEEQRDRERMAAEIGLSPEELAAIIAEVEAATPPPEPHR